MAIDPAFGLNSFGKPKMYSETQTLANNILTVLFGKPGSFPDGQFDIIKSSTTDKDGLEKPLILFVIPTIIKEVSSKLAVGVIITDKGISYNFAWIHE